MKRPLMALPLLLTAFCVLTSTARAQGTPGTVRYPTNVDTADSLFGNITDNPQTTLSGTISSGATTITVVSSGTSAFGSSGSLKIDNEVIYYSGKTSNTFTGCIRGRDGTTATTHVSGALVKSPLLVVHHRTLVDAIIAVENHVNSVAGGVSDLGTMATQDANSVNISGGTIAGVSFTGGLSVSGTVTATAFVGSGAGITGITGATGGISNTGSTTVGADTDADSVGIIDLQTRNLPRLRILNGGDVEIFGKMGFNEASPVGTLSATYSSTSHVFASFKTTNDPVSQPFEIMLTSTPNGGTNTRKDVVYSYGYNPRFQGGEHALYWQLETNYGPAVDDNQFEHYLEYRHGSTVIRPFGFVINRQTDTVGINNIGDSWQYQYVNGNQAMIMQGSGTNPVAIIFPQGASMQGFKNNSPPITQFLANGVTNASLPFWGAGDDLVVGGASGHGIHLRNDVGLNTDGPNAGMRMWIEPRTNSQVGLYMNSGGSATGDMVQMWGTADGGFVFGIKKTGAIYFGPGQTGSGDVGLAYVGSWGSGTLRVTNAGSGFGKLEIGTAYLNDGSVKQVTYGADDSGGAGFKVLRIPN